MLLTMTARQLRALTPGLHACQATAWGVFVGEALHARGLRATGRASGGLCTCRIGGTRDGCLETAHSSRRRCGAAGLVREPRKDMPRTSGLMPSPSTAKGHGPNKAHHHTAVRPRRPDGEGVSRLVGGLGAVAPTFIRETDPPANGAIDPSHLSLRPTHSLD